MFVISLVEKLNPVRINGWALKFECGWPKRLKPMYDEMYVHVSESNIKRILQGKDPIT